jgi:hypothetical protein
MNAYVTGQRLSITIRPARPAPLVALLALALAASPAAAQEEPLRGNGTVRPHASHDDAPVAQAIRRDGRIEIDGRLDDEAWSRAVVVDNFVQTEPHEGRLSTERTEVFVLYDDDALYIGARLWDSTGDIKSRLGRRDSMLGDSDWFYLYIDSHHDHLTAYQFSVNPAGVKRDEIVNSGFRNDVSWDAVWDAATSVDAEGWTVEMRIPFSQLRFSSADVQTWGLQLSRRINRIQEVSVFAFTPRSMRGGVARYGHLVGLEGIRPGKRLEIMPYVLGRGEYVPVAAGNPYRSGRDYFGGTGIDAKYRVTNALTVDATFNPDFGQVELDPAVVNLSAFETSFQEKRPFFVEGSDIFRFSDNRLFYSRRIGRTPQGALPAGVAFANRPDASTILGAFKLSGRTQRGWSIGLLQATTAEEVAPWVGEDGATGETIVEPMSNYVVGRVVRDLRAGQTQIGVLGTALNRRLDGSGMADLLRSSAYTGGVDLTHEFLNRTWSLDASFSFSHVLGSEPAMTRTQRLSSRYYQRPDARHVAVDSTLTALSGYSAKLELAKRAGLHWRGDASISAVSPGYEINDIGFQTGVDRVSASTSITYVENTPSRYFRNWRINGGPQVNWNHGGDWLGGRANINFNAQLANFWGGSVRLDKRIVGYDDRLTRGGPLARDRAGQSVNVNVNTDSRNRISGRINANYGWGAGEGLDRRVSLNMSMRPADFWSFSVGPSYSNSVATAQYVTSVGDSLMTSTYGRRYIFAGLDQTTVSMETRLNVNFRPELSLEVFAQPLIATGDFLELKQLRAPGAFEFDVFGRDVGSVFYNADDNRYYIDPDAGGPAAPFDLRNRDFSTRSLRGNAVMRWEYRPGSAIFLVWQQRRSASFERADFDLRRDARGLLDSPPSNIFLIKASYWLNL